MDLLKTQVQENMIIALIVIGTECCRKEGKKGLSFPEGIREVLIEKQL